MKKLGGYVAAALLAQPLAMTAANAQDFPSRPIEIVCSTSAGSTAAQWCQLMAQVLQQEDVLGVPVNVSYRGAGSGNEAAVYVNAQPADGHTILHANASWSGYMNLPTFEPEVEDFDFLVRVEKFIYALGTGTNSGFETFEDTVEHALANPGTLAVAGNKIGSIHHKHILSAYGAAGADVIHIPYEGSGDAVRDVLGGHVPLGLGSIGQLQPHVEAGNLRPLVVLNEERVDAMPDVPTIFELGHDYDISHQWQGIFVKAGTPDDVKQRLSDAFEKVVNSPEYAEYLSNSPHVEANFEKDPEILKDSFRRELDNYRQFMLDNGVL